MNHPQSEPHVTPYTSILNTAPDASIHHAAIESGLANLYRSGRAIWPDATPDATVVGDTPNGPARVAAAKISRVPHAPHASIHTVTGSSWIRAISYTPQPVKIDGRSVGIVCLLTHAGDIIIRYNVPSYHVGLIMAQSTIGRSPGKWYHKHIRGAYPGISKSDVGYVERVADVKAEFEKRLL